MTAICRTTRSFSRMFTAENVSKLSAQSPAWRRNALPAATWPRAAVRLRASPAKTSGGNEAICLRARSTATSSGHGGCCSARRSRHVEGVHGSVTEDQLKHPVGLSPFGFTLVERRHGDLKQA